jgi:hypothetical protein
MNTLILQFKKVTPLCLILGALACFAFSPKAQATPPPNTPDPGSVGGVLSTADGQSAMPFVTNGVANSAFGAFSLFSISTGNFNTAVGVAALDLNNGDSNTAVGVAALLLNTDGSENTAVGVDALLFNSTGSRHTAVGFGALQNCIAAPDFAGNTAVGDEALFSDTTGNFNTAIGDAALFTNTIGAVNTAIGLDALGFNTEGNTNTAVGANALFTNTNGDDNTAVGIFALFQNDTGNLNTAVGKDALNFNAAGSSNTAVGNAALIFSTGDGNTALGNGAGTGVTTANNVICIGNPGADVSDTAWIGNVFGVTTVSGTTAPVIVSDTGQLGTVASSEQFKKDINTMDRASEAVLLLRPVTFHYKSDAKETPQFGLIAEEVAKVNPALVLPDKEGKPYTVRYEAVNAMLLNEFLKEHSKVEQLEKQVEALTAGLQRVSAQIELRKPAPQTVLNNQIGCQPTEAAFSSATEPSRFLHVAALCLTHLPSPLFEIALMLVRFDHIVSVTVNADHGIM